MSSDPTSTPTESATIDRAARDHAARDTAADAEEPDSSAGRETDSDVDRVAALERRVADLEAELEAVRGLLDGVEAVDEAVERRASTALAKAEALEERFVPEAEGLVRERLPDADSRRGRTEGDRTDRHRGNRHDGDPDPGREPRGPDSQIRGGGDREAARRTDSDDVPGRVGRASARTIGNGRTPPADTDTTNDGTDGTGAISSVGSGAPDGDTAAEGTDRSLAARLRDAFR